MKKTLQSLLHRAPMLVVTLFVISVILIGSLVLGIFPSNKDQQETGSSWPKQTISLEVVVVGETVTKEKSIMAEVLTLKGNHRLRCYFPRTPSSEQILIGDGLAIMAKVKPPFHGQVYAFCTQWQWRQLSTSFLSIMERMRLRCLIWRHHLLEMLRMQDINDEVYGIVAAMTLGDKSHLDTATKDMYAQVGASHILALSGLHLMIIYTVISLLVGRRRLHFISQEITILAIWAFALLVGLSPSVVRAATMITIYALLSLGYRDSMSVNTIAFTAVIMLVINPLLLFDISFQLSFASVLAIVLINPGLYSLIPTHVLQRHQLLKAVWSLTTVSIAAQLGSAPLVAYYFGRLPLYFLLSNFVVVPIATIILYLTPLLFITFWCTPLQSVIAHLLSWMVTIMNSLLEWIASLPYSSIDL